MEKSQLDALAVSHLPSLGVTDARPSRSRAKPSSVDQAEVGQRHGVEHLVQELQSAVQVDLHPAGGVLDALPRVVGAPALHEAQPQDAQTPEVVHPYPRRRREAWGEGGEDRASE